MRRIALAAALATTLAGGAAALAATPDAGTPDAAPPDPYQGAWALAIDGQYAGPVAQVQGCGLAAQLVRDQSGGEHLAQPAPEECTFQAGAGMTPGFEDLVNDGLAGVPTLHQIELIRTDAPVRYGLRLDHARLSSVTLPEVQRASTAPVALEIGVKGERITRDPSPGVTIPKLVRPKAPGLAQLKVSVAGQDIGASAAGPWTAEVKTADAGGTVRESSLPTGVDIGDLALRVPESSKAMTRVLDPWVRGALADGKPDVEQPVTVTAGGITLTLDRAAPQRADLVPRADGARTYSLYAEHAVIAAG